MKLNKTKFLIPSLAIVAGACLVGSVSGTVAWYQYSTRVTAALVGTSVKCSEQLKIQAEHFTTSATNTGDYKTDIRSSEMTSVAPSANFKPVTYSTALTGNSQLTGGAFKSNPIYGSFATGNWRDAAVPDYVQFKLNFNAYAVDGSNTRIQKSHLYLTNLTIQAHSGSANDLSSAIRVHISDGTASKNLLLSKKTTAETTALHGYLDLNGDGQYDGNGRYEWDGNTAQEYGLTSSDQVTVANAVAADTGLSAIGNDGRISTAGYDFGSVLKTGDAGKTLEITIWLEGWAKLDPAASAITDGTYADKAALEAAVAGSTLSPAEGDVHKTIDGKVYRYESSAWVELKEDAVWDKKYQGMRFDVGFEFAVNPTDGADE